MDLGSESVEENEVNHDGNGNGGPYGNEKTGLGLEGNSGVNGLDQKGTVDEVEVDSEEGVNSKGTPTKGVGLKKWKRIRRNVVKDPNSSADSGKVLKRGLPANPNLSEKQPYLRDVKERSDGSSDMFGNVVFSDGNVIHGSSSDSRYALGSGFVVGTDSENSEDRSSKSSTAASEPKLRPEKNRSKNVNSKHLPNSAQRVQQGKGRTESSKKPGGGGRVQIEKENSFSSLESDSRSSNFKQGGFSVTSNGTHSGRTNIYDGVNSGEAHVNEHFTEGVEAVYGNENIVEDEDLLPDNLATNLSWDVTEEKSVNNQPSSIGDPLIESVNSLQAVQEALQEELQKFREIGIEAISPDVDDSAKCSSASAGTTVDLGLNKLSHSDQSGAEEIKQTASSSSDPRVLSLTQNINILEGKLEELQGVLALKDSRIAELETSLSSVKISGEESARTAGFSEIKCEGVESELEHLFRLKIETEIEYLAFSKAAKQNLKDGASYQQSLLEEQEKLSESQAQVLHKLVDAEGKASVLKNKAEELEKYCGDSVVVQESFVLQKKVCKVTFYLLIQIIFFVFFFWFFLSQLSPNSGMVVPT
ncbi:WPP domain-interacting protein 2-like [Vigna umbellata]|uniref:WPP domain-interacting protein 2-like n=1 Tax=Vigna umbellata TaxID=87088 RepID=UPI001F5E8D1C|nr:WPP domain-interacting protein 2-like [Vigna umbellata]XP_047151074.1 WPP domain-interacting protein 2-like [Vigna umbellata]